MYLLACGVTVFKFRQLLPVFTSSVHIYFSQLFSLLSFYSSAMVNITCKGCGTRVVNPITCALCGISAHPACLSRTGHPFSGIQFLPCKGDGSSSDRVNPPSDSGPISEALINQIEITIARSVENILSKELAKFQDQFWKRYAEDMDKVNSSLRNLTDRVSNLENNPAKTDSSSFLVQGQENVIQEIVERERRSVNLVLFNLEEVDCPASTASPAVSNSDVDLIKNIFNVIYPADYTDIKAVRLGKKSQGRNRPVCVSLKSKSDVTAILKNKSKYGGPVMIAQDRTPKQREHLAELRLELQNLISTGVTDKTIRYINGSPCIVNATPNSREKN